MPLATGTHLVSYEDRYQEAIMNPNQALWEKGDFTEIAAIHASISPDKSPTQFIELFETFYGPTMNAVEAAQKNGNAKKFPTQLVEPAKAQNKNKDAGALTPATCMRVTVSI